MKNERKRLILFCFSFYSLFGAWKIVGMTMTQMTHVVVISNNLSSTEQTAKTKTKQGKSFSLIFVVFDRLSVNVLWLDKADFPEDLYTECPC